MSDVTTFVDQVRAYFLARPYQWIPAVDLERVGGRQAWRTRVSDVRRVYRMTIENRVRVRRDVADGTTWRQSEYRYVPARGVWVERASDSPEGVTAVVSAEGRLF